MRDSFHLRLNSPTEREDFTQSDDTVGRSENDKHQLNIYLKKDAIAPSIPPITPPMAERTPPRAPPIERLCKNAKMLPEATLPIAAWIEAAMEPAYLAREFMGSIRGEARCLNEAYPQQAQWR